MKTFVVFSALLCFFSGVLGHEGHDHSTHITPQSSSDQQVSFTVYYESLCPDSIKFFKDQLDPTYRMLAKYMAIELVPFGISKQSYSNNTFHFECHHGPNECYGNIVQACAIKRLYDAKDRFNFVSCLMLMVDGTDKTNATYPIDKCAKKYNLDVSNVENCVRGNDGLQSLSEMGNKTEKLTPRLKNVPSVAVNNHFAYDDSSNALKDLKTVLCTNLKAFNATPTECKSGSGTLSTSIVLMILSSFIFTIFS